MSDACEPRRDRLSTESGLVIAGRRVTVGGGCLLPEMSCELSALDEVPPGSTKGLMGVQRRSRAGGNRTLSSALPRRRWSAWCCESCISPITSATTRDRLRSFASP